MNKPITINRTSANLIDGVTSVVLRGNFGAFMLRVTPANNWMFV